MRVWLVLSSLALIGCGDDEEEDYERTPAGYKVSFADAGSVSGGYITKERLFQEFDRRVAEWIAAHPDYAGVPGQILFTLFDDYRFATEYSSSGYAAGLFTANTIIVAIYTRSVASEKPSLVPPHTVRLNPDDGLWYYGWPEGMICPATFHELNHAIGVHQD